MAVLLALAGCQEAPAPDPSEKSSQTAAEVAAEALKYICPMHPQIVRDEPGTCPICGMNLVARSQKPVSQAAPEIEVSGPIAQAINLRTAKVKKATLWRYIKTLGMVSYDETHLVHVHPRASGWIEGLKIAAEGDPVSKDQDLMDLYSPEILDAQVNYLIALGPAQDQQRKNKAKNRLLLLDVPEDVIEAIGTEGTSRRRIPIRSPQDGVITRLMIRDGMYVKPDTELMTLADTSRLWVVADIYEHQIDWIKPGLEAEISTPALPGRTWKGTLDYVYPELDPKTRTLRVRIGFDNPDRLLKPNFFANVIIYGGPKKDVLSLPREALILETDRSLVIRSLGKGRFQPAEVKVGMRTAQEVEILSGLKIGDEVVVSGQFLLDSEANIQASLNRLDTDAPQVHQHSGAH
jgi:Cu(I)/Ag(I) efflux system membrane fusion protein